MYIFVASETKTKDETNIEGPSNVPEVDKEEEETQKKKVNILSICNSANFKASIICHFPPE